MGWFDLVCMTSVTIFAIYSIYQREKQVKELTRSNMYLCSLLEEYEARLAKFKNKKGK